ncbi:ATP-binding protein [Serinicoccus sp. CNJ-927]|uniref:ATP-binding protein n=1 Tax=Serinicoccus sp. CNJ-927 TaxID=1904970 RepID=UPI000963C4B5|nr:ATP-binding protein [Serinicoccus sp. CNJ-927]OLT43910.1 ATP-binding protein [Serinicoccus sp. CNJ-927]
MRQRLGRPSRRSGRGVAGLLADFGHDLPTVPESPVRPKDRLAWSSAAIAGPRRRSRGWAAATAPVSAWRMTSEQAAALWPLITGPGLPATGAFIGMDVLSGAAHYCDPHGWTLNPDVPVTNPNIMVFGKPGTGKSATVKAFCLRSIDFGYRILVPGDPKDEYEDLARFLGVAPIAVGPGMAARVNPLSLGPLGQGWDQLASDESQARAASVFKRWELLVRGLVGSQRVGESRVAFGPVEAEAVREVLKHLTGFERGVTRLSETTLPHVWEALRNPSPDLVDQTRYSSARQLLDETRVLRDALGQLCSGVLGGMFDDHTNIDIDWSAPIQTLSLSRLEPLGDEAVGVALTCLNSWASAQRELSSAADRRIVVRDESWKQLRLGPEAVKSYDADLRLSRGAGGKGGDIQIAVLHKPSDLLSAGDHGSQSQMIAKDLLHLCDVKIMHGQRAGVADELDTLLGLGPVVRDAITTWAMQQPGRGVWQIGSRHMKIQTILHPIERDLTWTNQAIADAA